MTGSEDHAPLESGGFETPRMRAEPLTLEHAEKLFPILSSDPELYRYIPEKAPESLAALKTRFAQLLAGESADGKERWLNWTLSSRRDGSFVGSLQATVRELDQSALIAYSVFDDHRRQGLGKEAVAALVQWLFDTCLSVETIRAQVDDQNLASLRLAESAGMTWAGTEEDADFFDGASRTEAVFSVTRSRFPRQET